MFVDQGSFGGDEIVCSGDLSLEEVPPEQKEVIVDMSYKGKVVGKLNIFLIRIEDKPEEKKSPVADTTVNQVK